MILAPCNEPVGSWSFWIELGEVDFDVLRECCEALEAEGLMRPRWLVLDRLGASERVSWREVSLDAVDDLRVEGEGWTLTPGGQRLTSPYVMRVSLDVRMGHLTLRTWSDAWMAVNLEGVSQPEVHALNAPRLAAALREVARRTGWRLRRGHHEWTRVDDDGVRSLGHTGSLMRFLRPLPSWAEVLSRPPEDLYIAHDTGFERGEAGRLLVLCSDGDVAHEWWQAGRHRRWGERINSQILQRVFQLLSESGFPEWPAPQESDPGGASRTVEVTSMGLSARVALSPHTPALRRLCDLVDDIADSLRARSID